MTESQGGQNRKSDNIDRPLLVQVAWLGFVLPKQIKENHNTADEPQDPACLRYNGVSIREAPNDTKPAEPDIELATCAKQ